MKELLHSHFGDVWDFLTEVSDVIMVVLDDNLVIQEHNESFVTLLSVRESLVGADFSTLIAGDGNLPLPLDGHQATKTFQTVLSSGGTSRLTLLCRASSLQDGKSLVLGRRIPVSDSAVLNQMTTLSNETINLARELKRKNRALERERAKVKTLQGILPICMHCKGIRDDEGYWTQLEQFISEHSDATFSHGICDACRVKYYPEFAGK